MSGLTFLRGSCSWDLCLGKHCVWVELWSPVVWHLLTVPFSLSCVGQLECQDALETAARAEGLSLDVSMHSQLRILDEEHPKGKYHHGLSALKPIRTTSK